MRYSITQNIYLLTPRYTLLLGEKMKKLVLATALSSLMVSSFAAELNTDEQKIAYAIGSQIGDSLQAVNDSIALDESVLFEAISDSLQKKATQLNDEQMNSAMQALQVKMTAAMEAKAKAETEKNKAESAKFLAENKAKDGVKTTSSGLQYRVIKAAEGKKPMATDIVKVNYKGTLTDGTEFDSSAKSGGPIEFPLNAVIPGWTEGLQLMTVGSKYEFVIPAELAYGDMAPPSIGPARALIFEVELLDINANQEKSAPVAGTTDSATAPATTESTSEAVDKVDAAKAEVKKAVTDKANAVKEQAQAVITEKTDDAKKAATDAIKAATE